jgi:molybdopterin molybdotransferase
MPEFLTLLPPPQALTLFLGQHFTPLQSEIIPTTQALHRVTASSVFAPHPLPTFRRSTVDGYAVRAMDTFGASESIPAYLTLTGETLMGESPTFSVSAAQCALIHTGGMLSDGADAVVMLEYTQSVSSDEIEVLRPVAVGENILKVGEDVAAEEEVIPRARRLRPAEIGGLMALGITALSVVRSPRVGILSTGDEIVSPEAVLQPGQVRDVNTYTLKALIEQCGGLPVIYGIIPDRKETLLAVASSALQECDVLIITAGSSASSRDLTAEVINLLGKPGVLVHGVNVRPGKPTILAACDGKPVVGLPGNPVSALVIAQLFIVPLMDTLLDLPPFQPQPNLLARLTLNVPSQTGREDWIAVRLIEQSGRLHAEPIFGKSNLIFTLVRADGLVHIPAAATGLNAGEMVEVLLMR